MSLRSSRAGVTVAALLFAVSGCGGAGNGSGDPSAADEMPTAAVEAGPAPALAAAAVTRADVEAAVRCSEAMNSALAAGLVLGEGLSVSLRDQVRWAAEVQRRAQAAGMEEAELTRLRETTTVPMSTEDQREAARPIVADCLANLPGA